MNAALEPVRLVSGQVEKLRHLRMMAKGIEGPTHGNVHAEFVAGNIAFRTELAVPRIHRSEY